MNHDEMKTRILGAELVAGIENAAAEAKLGAEIRRAVDRAGLLNPEDVIVHLSIEWTLGEPMVVRARHWGAGGGRLVEFVHDRSLGFVLRDSIAGDPS